MQKRLLILLFLLLWGTLYVSATHQRAAEITYKWLGGLTYEVTITMYTYTPSPADDARTSLPIRWGDNSISDIPRITFNALPDNYTLNVYQMNHTYPASGTYIISVEDPNRNFGVVNIPNSVNVPIYVESLLVINPFLGENNSVQLLNPPIDQGCVGKLFVHNASAYDPDGDSLSYRLVNCRGANGLEIPGYTFPVTSNIFAINETTGDLTWENPVLQGEYNIAFLIEEWRNGILIGSVMRDMQILIGACNNNPPVITSPESTCVIAGQQLTFDVSATDPDNNAVFLTASGAPFELADNPASIIPDPGAGTPTASTSFFWNTQCIHIQRLPYNVLFKARDVHPEVSLTALKTTSIKVMAPAVENLQTTALGIGINLSWENYSCTNAVGFRLYRRNGTSSYIPGECETGVSAASGFQLLQQIQGAETVNFRDDNNGNGLVPGIDYCYVITAYFSDGAESIMSNQSCSRLNRDLPIMTHVSNDSTLLTSGRVLLAWSKPTELDTIQYPGPYQYDLIRYQGISGENQGIVFTGIGLNDTLFTDNGVNLNTSPNPYSYEVKLRSLAVGDIGSSRKASSVFLEITPTDKELVLSWSPQVPWTNDSAEIFRFSGQNNAFEKIGSSKTGNYRDKDLVNGQVYRYYIRTIGGYSAEGFVHPIINYSQLAEGIPIDNLPPCPPEILVETDCEKIENTLYFINLIDSCSYDISRFRIYYTPSASVAFSLIDSVPVSQLSYTHKQMEYVTGCYYAKAVDSTGNVSMASNIFCVDYDACPIYELPNVFTPNADQYNDFLVPINYPSTNPKANVDRIELTIFNRWGNVVFETADPAINWDGKNQRTGQDCADGTYFYVCEVFFQGFDGPVQQRLQGSITIIR
ncbi:MAG: gliding motility-associated C-terminal domain-containing protein [Bacteroidales bacterium]|nr:gliding motility-associated C-terminal domain-containing protein [Bacteroidales bacterium]